MSASKINQAAHGFFEKRGCSIVICCYNGGHRIQNTLQYLAGQEGLGDTAWEVIIVDNASTDNTAEIAAQAWENLGSPVQLKIIREPTPGLSNARRAGILACQYDISIFCDDDNWLASTYVSNVCGIFLRHPQVGVVGGVNTPVWEDSGSFPSWFFTYANGFAVGVQAMRSGDITVRRYIWGAGMALRTSLLRYLYLAGVNNLLNDRMGSLLGSGGDSEICMWYIMAGFRLYYDDTLHLSHFVPKSRQSLDYVFKIYQGFEEATQVLLPYNRFLNRRECLRAWKASPLMALKADLLYRILPKKARRNVEVISMLLISYARCYRANKS